MNRDAVNAIPVLLLTSPIDWPLMVVMERALPIFPLRADLDKGRPGGWAHSGKDWFTEAFRKDPQYFSKLARFAVWWAVVYLSL